VTEPAHGFQATGAPPGLGQRFAAAHQTRPAAAPSAPPGLVQMLLGLSWMSPTSHALAVDAITRLTRTQAELAEYTAPIPGSAPLTRAVNALHTRIGFVLRHWEGEIAALETSRWDPAHAQALDRDLREIASTGALALKLATARASTPGPGGIPSPAPAAAVGGRRPARARHRGPGDRSQTGSAVPLGETGVTTLGKLPEGAARMLFQAAGIVAATAIVSVVCFESFDRQPPTHTSPARQAAVGVRGANTPPIPTPSRRIPLASPSATGLPAAAGTVTSLQIQLLGASTASPRIEVIVYLDTVSTAPVTVAISYHAVGQADTGTTTRTATGSTSYQLALPIDAAAFCNRAVLVSASAGELSASQSTTAGACATARVSPSINGSNA